MNQGSNSNVLSIMAFISVVVLGVITFVFINNTRQKIVEIDNNMKLNNQILKNNLTSVNTTFQHNDDVLNNKYSNLFEVDNKDDEDSTNDVLKIKKNTQINGTLSVCDVNGNCQNVSLV